MKLAKEAKVGLLAVATLTIFYIGFNFLKGLDIFSKSNEYYAFYNDVEGLQASNPVTFNGVTVGRVMEIEPNQEKGNVKVTFLVDEGIQLTENTVAVLADISLLGSKAIKLLIKPGKAINQEGVMKGGRDDGLVASATERLSPTLDKVDSVLVSLNYVVKQFDNTGEAMKVMLASATQTSNGVNAVVAQNSNRLAEITTNAAKLTASLNMLTADIDRQMKPILAKSSTFTDSLNALRLGKTVNTLNQSVGSLQGILNDINKGQGTIGKLTQDEALYRNLTSSANSLDALITDIKANPKSYVHFSVFGGGKKKDKKDAEINLSDSTSVNKK